MHACCHRRSTRVLLRHSITVAAIAGLASWALLTPANASPPAGVTICHIPPGNPDARVIITVHPRAVPAHLAHGDTLNACEGPF